MLRATVLSCMVRRWGFEGAVAPAWVLGNLPQHFRALPPGTEFDSASNW